MTEIRRLFLQRNVPKRCESRLKRERVVVLYTHKRCGSL
jgi:hypothetical protein